MATRHSPQVCLDQFVEDPSGCKLFSATVELK